MVIFHEMVQIQFSLAEWFHSFLVLPAVGFKAWHTDVRYRKLQTAFQRLSTERTRQSPWGKSDISTHCIGYLQYRAEPKQVEVGVSVGEILLSTLHFTNSVFQKEGLKLTAYQCTCVWLDRFSRQLIGGAWTECPARTSYSHLWPKKIIRRVELNRIKLWLLFAGSCLWSVLSLKSHITAVFGFLIGS